MYLGAIDTFLTENEWGYPQLIMGCLTQEHPYTYGAVDFAGMSNPGAMAIGSTTYPGPGWLRWADGNFYQVANWDVSYGLPAFSADEGINISPSGGTQYATPAIPNAWYSTLHNWFEIFQVAVTISGQQELLRVNNEFILLPCTLSTIQFMEELFGNMIGVFGFNPDSAINAEDQIYVGGAVYRCFQNCNKSNRNYFFAMKED